MWIRFPGGAAPRGGRPVASEQRWVALVCDDHCSLPANHSTNEVVCERRSPVARAGREGLRGCGYLVFGPTFEGRHADDARCRQRPHRKRANGARLLQRSAVDGNGGMAGPYLSMRVAPPSTTGSAPPTTAAAPCRAPSTSRSTDGGVTPRAHHPSEQSVKTNATFGANNAPHFAHPAGDLGRLSCLRIREPRPCHAAEWMQRNQWRPLSASVDVDTAAAADGGHQSPDR